jgi:predicted nucleotidyltransferase
MAHANVDPGREALLRALTQANVAFVVIGGAALQSYDQSHRTDDIDVMPEHSQANLAQTAHGKLDITFHPSGFPDGYEQLRPRAARREVAQTSATVRVVALEDVEHSKRTANRPKDRDYLARVGRLQAPPP